MAIDQAELNVPEDVSTLPELNSGYLAQVFEGLSYDPDQEEADPSTYVILHHSGVSYKGVPYELVYKLCRQDYPNHKFVTKLSLMDRGAFNSMSKDGLVTQRNYMFNPMVEDDYTLTPGEIAFRYLDFNMATDPLEVRSRLEVDEDLRGERIGSLLFDQYEPMARDLLTRLPEAKGKEVKLIVRANSDPKGWTEYMAESRGYESLPRNAYSGFPTFVRTIAID